MDPKDIAAGAAGVSILAAIGQWLVLLWRGGRRSAEERTAILDQARGYVDDHRRHTSTEHDKIWTELQRVKDRAEADRLVQAELKADVHYIRGAVDRLLAKIDSRGND